MCREVKSHLLVYFPRVTRDFCLGNGPPPKLWGNGDGLRDAWPRRWSESGP